MNHYDIDGACPFFASYVRECAERVLLLTKVVVYIGFGAIATVTVPAMFKALW